MRSRRAGWATLLLLCAACLVPEHGNAEQLPPSGPFPDAPCNMASRMDIYIGPDGTLWECVCEALKAGHVCDWFDQGPATAARNQKRRKRALVRLRVRILPRLVVIRL